VQVSGAVPVPAGVPVSAGVPAGVPVPALVPVSGVTMRSAHPADGNDLDRMGLWRGCGAALARATLILGERAAAAEEQYHKHDEDHDD
jgi:hypothetical protein